MSAANRFQAGLFLPSERGRFGMLARPVLLLLIVLATALDYRFLNGVRGAPSFTAFEAVCYLTFMMLLADGIIYRHTVREVFAEVWSKNRYVLLYVLWIGTLSFANFFRGYGFVTLSELKDILPSILMVIVLYAYGRSPDALRRIVKIYIVGLGINIALGVSQGLVGAPRPVAMSVGAAAKMDLNGQIMSKNMSTGLFTHPNGFAMFMIPCAVLLVLIAARKIELGRWWRVFAFVTLPPLAFALYRSQGKGAIAWALMGCLMALLPVRSRRKAFYLMFAAMLAGVVVLAAGSVYGADRFHIRSLTTMLTRVQLWQAGLYVLSHDWGAFCFGGAFNEVFVASYRFTKGSFPYPNTHNSLLNQAVFYGVPGMLLYLALIWKSVTTLAFCPDDKLLVSKGVATWATASVVALVGEYFFEPASEGVLLQAQFFFLLAFCLVCTGRPVHYYSAGGVRAHRAASLGSLR